MKIIFFVTAVALETADEPMETEGEAAAPAAATDAAAAAATTASEPAATPGTGNNP